MKNRHVKRKISRESTGVKLNKERKSEEKGFKEMMGLKKKDELVQVDIKNVKAQG